MSQCSSFFICISFSDNHVLFNSWHFLTEQAGTSFYKMTGLGPLPQALYNGEPFKYEKWDIQELETALLQKMMDVTIYLQREVFMVGKDLWESIWWIVFINDFILRKLLIAKVNFIKIYLLIIFNSQFLK